MFGLTETLPYFIDKIVCENIPREFALAELPQTWTEVVAVYAHTEPHAIVHVIEDFRESV